MHLHFYEPDQANVTIDQYHREAIEAEQLRVARSTKPGRITTLTMRFQAAIGTLVTVVGWRLHREPAGSRESVTSPTVADAAAGRVAGA